MRCFHAEFTEQRGMKSNRFPLGGEDRTDIQKDQES